MIKAMLMTGTMLVAMPALAQTTTAPTAPATPSQTTTQTAPMPPAADPAAGTTEVKGDMAAQTAPVTQTPSTTTAQTAPAQTTGTATATQPAATGDAVAQVVDAEFGTYDKDADGKLNKTEFSSWMVTLKSKSDPAATPAAASTKAWVNGAWASADKDKSAGVTKAELTGFLSQGKS